MAKNLFNFAQIFTCFSSLAECTSLLCAFAIAQNIFRLTPLRRDGSSFSEIACCANP
jgi:hypothetical protein